MILLNRGQCPHCGDIIISRFRHDQRYCSCKKSFVDGGRDYFRAAIGVIDMCIEDDKTHETRRKWISWGTRGIDGKSPLTYVAIKDITNEHLLAIEENVLKGEYPTQIGLVLETILEEIKLRKLNSPKRG